MMISNWKEPFGLHGLYFIFSAVRFTAKLFNWKFQPLEVVFRWRDPQLQVSETYSDLTKCRLTI